MKSEFLKKTGVIQKMVDPGFLLCGVLPPSPTIVHSDIMLLTKDLPFKCQKKRSHFWPRKGVCMLRPSSFIHIPDFHSDHNDNTSSSQGPKVFLIEVGIPVELLAARANCLMKD